MKKTILSIFTLSVFAIIFSSHSEGVESGITASGSPGDGNNCTMCHGGGALDATTDLITTDIPSAGYVGGTEYNITVTVADAAASKFGFQITSETAAGVHVGTFGDGGNSNVDIILNAGYVTHTSANTGTASKAWTMKWTAPSSETGGVTFYAAGNGADGNNENTGVDNIYTDSEAVTEDGFTEITANANASNSISIFPNPTSDFFVVTGSTNNAVINLYDLKGALLKKFVGNGNHTVSDIMQGTYLVIVENEGTSSVEKLIIR
jgi:hypothetical protein